MLSTAVSAFRALHTCVPVHSSSSFAPPPAAFCFHLLHRHRPEAKRRSLSVLSYCIRMSAENDNPVLYNDSATAKDDGRAVKSVNVIIKGKVQGVFYRKWTVDTAQKMGLHGWVRNCRDGSVEAVFAGPSDVVDNMIEKCRGGPAAARVAGLDVSSWDKVVPQGFEQKPTTW